MNEHNRSYDEYYYTKLKGNRDLYHINIIQHDLIMDAMADRDEPLIGEGSEFLSSPSREDPTPRPP